MISTKDIQIRDPFIVPVEAEGLYYLYGTTDDLSVVGPAIGFDTYRSADLENWEGPLPAFRPEPGFWSDRDYWAPEVHIYQDRFYMFATFNAEWVHRGTQILVSDSLEGPFRPHSSGPVTPRDWGCLDGTLLVDADGAPWMVFCHEWTQVQDGEMCAIRLTPDLREPLGDPILLFRASEVPWVGAYPGPSDFVTDGPFFYTTKTGQLLMMWSSFRDRRYAIGIARSTTGSVTGPWLHDVTPLYDAGGGHGMLFKTFDDRLMLTFHSPNDSPNERAVFVPVRDLGNTLEILKGEIS